MRHLLPVIGYRLSVIRPQQITDNREQRTRAFTLVELLVVIAIMAIIVGISLPALQGLGQSSGLRGSVVQMKGALNMTRQWAITHRERACLVFPTNNPGLYNAFTIFSTNTLTGSNYYAQGWDFLPKGIVINFADSDLTSVRLPNPTNPAQQISAGAMIFRPDGSVSYGGSLPQISLCEGWAGGFKPAGATQILQVVQITGTVRLRR